MRKAYAHCEAEVRAADMDRYLATLFAPAAARPHIFALYAFNAEMARVRERAKEPLAGEVRLQFWRDTLAASGAGEAAGHPIAVALNDTIERFDLPRAAFLALMDARRFDLYDEPMPSLAALDDYARATASALFRLVAQILAGRSEAIVHVADHAGRAYAIAGLLRAFPIHAARGQLYLPLELIAREGASPYDVLAGRAAEALRVVLAELRVHVRGELRQTWDRLPDVPRRALPAFLPLALIESYLARMEWRDYDPFRTPVELPQWRRQWKLWWAARREFPLTPPATADPSG